MSIEKEINNITNSEKKKSIVNNEKYRNFRQILNAFYKDEIESIQKESTQSNSDLNKNIRLIPKLIFNKSNKDIKIEIYIENKKAKKRYKIKNLTEFYNRFLYKEIYKYGEKLEFIHTQEAFEEKSKHILKFVLKYAEIIKYVSKNGNIGYRYYGKSLSDKYILLNNSGIDELFEIMIGQKTLFQKESVETVIEFSKVSPNILFKVKKHNAEEYIISSNINIYEYSIFEGKEYSYILIGNILYRYDEKFEKSVIKLLEMFKKNFTEEIKFSNNELSDFFSLIMPKMKKNVELKNIDVETVKKYTPQKLKVKMFLDFEKNGYMVCDIRFSYMDVEFNPIKEKEPQEFTRNLIKENESLDLLIKSGFMLDVKNSRFIISDDDKIYNFIENEFDMYMNMFEILVTDEFKLKKVKKTKKSLVSVRVENNLLNIDLTKIDINKEEIKDILNKYKLKKKYYRLKDGSFLKLEGNEEIKFLSNLQDGMDIDSKEIAKGYVKVPLYRSLYLDNLLKNIDNTKVEKEDSYLKVVGEISKKEQINEKNNSEIDLPKNLNKKLRNYQKFGFKWLKILDEYKLGGILADDMGLGKTVQMLSVILGYKENTKRNLPSIVISPSSLSLNWKNEAEKFAPTLKVLVVNGKAEERKLKINKINEYDLIITSYDLLKRDIDVYEEKGALFKYAVADEAQYIKNSNTQNAKALKKISSEIRYALTGTPIENSLAELWSIFDYIMPGYLFSYRKFKNIYEIPIVKEEDKEAMDKLKMLIDPFILRRIKKDVLKELPDKTITVLNSQMDEEQSKIYMSYLAQAKTELLQEIDINGYESSKIKILALLTRLRQICCHPSLFINNYKGESSKLEQCIEVVKDAVDGGHKILIFSVYSSMFEIIEKRLNKEKINYYKLTGQTKVTKRVDLVEDFNTNPNVKVFLISLKAGGTGLNLIGADMVIHYDPWWNISAENQATDRAHRIGQKNNVQVYKLITKNSIEEKISELQEKKAKLIDNMLSKDNKFVNSLSKEDILSLFE